MKPNNMAVTDAEQPTMDEIFASFRLDGLNICEYISEAGLFVVQKSGMYGLVNSFGRIVVPTYVTRMALESTIRQLQEPLNPVLERGMGIMYSRCMDAELSEVNCSKKYVKCVNFVNGFCVFTNGDKLCLATAEMKELTEYIYDEIILDNMYKNFIVPYRVGELWGLLSVEGTVVVAPKYKSIGKAVNYGFENVIKGKKTISLLVYLGDYQDTVVYEYACKLNFENSVSVAVKNKKMGYIDMDGNVLYPFELDYACSFFNGMGKIMRGGSVGFVNSELELCVPMAFDGARDFYEELCAVCIAGNWGYIDRRCKVIIPLMYRAAFDFSDGVARVQLHDGSFAIINTVGEILLQDAENIKILDNPTIGMIPYNDGNMCGFKYVGNVSWMTDIPAVYDMVRPFSAYHAIVMCNGMLGMIDRTGRLRLDTIFETISGFDSRGVAIASLQNGDTCFLVRMPDNPETILMLAYDELTLLLDNMAIVGVCEDGSILYGVVNIYGVKIVPTRYKKIVHLGGSSFLLVDKTGMTYARLSETNGNQYSESYSYMDSSFKNERLLVSKNGLYGYIDKTGKCVIDCLYEFAYAFSGGLALVKLGGYFGYINTEGEVVIDICYESAAETSFISGYAVVVKDGLYGVIDRAGNEIVPCIYTDINFLAEQTILLQKADGIWQRLKFIQKHSVDFIDEKLGIYTEDDKVYIHDEEIFSMGSLKKIQNYQLIEIVSSGKLIKRENQLV